MTGPSPEQPDAPDVSIAWIAKELKGIAQQLAAETLTQSPSHAPHAALLWDTAAGPERPVTAPLSLARNLVEELLPLGYSHRMVAVILVQLLLGSFGRELERAGVEHEGLTEPGGARELTAREISLLSHLADGLQLKSVASKLGVSRTYCKVLQARLCRRFGAKNRSALVAIWTEMRVRGGGPGPRVPGMTPQLDQTAFM